MSARVETTRLATPSATRTTIDRVMTIHVAARTDSFWVHRSTHPTENDPHHAQLIYPTTCSPDHLDRSHQQEILDATTGAHPHSTPDTDRPRHQPHTHTTVCER